MPTPGITISGGLPTTISRNLLPGIGPTVAGGGGPGTKPWAWVGSYLLTLEDLISPSLIGAGTQCPINWDRTHGSTAADQICRFEVATAEITATASGTTFITFTAPPGSGFSDTQMSFSFSCSGSITLHGASDWSCIVPGGISTPSTIIARGSTVNCEIVADDGGTATLPWGDELWGLRLIADVGEPSSGQVDVAAVDGTGTSDGFTTYTKTVSVKLETGAALDDVLVTDNTVDGFPSTPYSVDAFHSSAPFFGAQNTDPDYIVLSSCTLKVTGTLTPPPNL